MSGNTNSDILLAGAIAAFSVDLLVYPLDTLKTRLQSPDYSRLYLNASAQTVNKKALFRGLYQGVGSVIIATLPSSGAFFTTYEAVKHFLTIHNPPLSGQKGHGSRSHLLPQPVIHAAASSLAELVSCAILTPAEVIKQNAQMVSAERSSSGNATMQTLSRFRQNPLALWRGYTALAGRNLPFTALQFPLFERLKEVLKSWRQRRGKATGTIVESGIVTAVSAGLAGSLAAVVTTPIDVVKTRIMLAAADSEPSRDQAKPSSTNKPQQQLSSQGSIKTNVTAARDGIVDAVGRATKPARWQSGWSIGRQVLKEEGVKGLMRGGALRGVWTMLGSGLYLGVYESGRVYLARRRGEDVDEDDIL